MFSKTTCMYYINLWTCGIQTCGVYPWFMVYFTGWTFTYIHYGFGFTLCIIYISYVVSCFLYKEKSCAGKNGREYASWFVYIACFLPQFDVAAWFSDDRPIISRSVGQNGGFCPVGIDNRETSWFQATPSREERVPKISPVSLWNLLEIFSIRCSEEI